MDIKTKLNRKTIYDKRFTKNVKGYDALEVDQFLDLVLYDYLMFEKEAALLATKIKQLIDKNNELLGENENLTHSNAEYEKMLGSIKSNDNVNTDNLPLINRIRKLEKALHDLGVDPTTIK